MTNDMRKVIAPKSDQLNADDLIAGPMTIEITDVVIKPGSEQPVSIFFKGDNGKPWRCCKSMSRVLVHVWGADAKQYIGKSLTLYRDPKVKWGGMEVGGIRISHMSDIPKETTMVLTVTQKARAPYVVKPLQVEAQQPQKQRQTPQEYAEELLANIAQAPDAATLDNIERKAQKALAKMSEDDSLKSLHDGAIKAFADKRQEFGGVSDPFAVQD